MMCNELSCPEWDNFPSIVAIPILTLLTFHEIFGKHEETLFLIFVLELATHFFLVQYSMHWALLDRKLGEHYSHPVLRAIPDFQTLRRPWHALLKGNFYNFHQTMIIATN